MNPPSSEQSSLPNELILLPSLKARFSPTGEMILTRKFMEGVAEYAKNWPGSVAVLLNQSDRPGVDFDQEALRPELEPAKYEIRPTELRALARRLQSAAVVLAFLSPDEAPTAELCEQLGVPLVFSSEYTASTEKQIIELETRNPILRLRRKLWVDHAEKTRRRILKGAAGVQCSGTPTYDVYRNYNRNALLFFDNRVRLADVISESRLAEKNVALQQRKTLRLTFGGRLTRMKGVQDLPRIASELKKRRVDFRMNIYGRGDLESELAKQLMAYEVNDVVTLHDSLSFTGGWLPVLRDETDLFVCCHPQGDPSSTYPEVMSCGTPIVGYGNEAFAGIVRLSRAGWMTPIGDVVSMADRIEAIAGNRSEAVMAAVKGREFAIKHCFEVTFADRTRHLLDSSRFQAGP